MSPSMSFAPNQLLLALVLAKTHLVKRLENSGNSLLSIGSSDGVESLAHGGLSGKVGSQSESGNVSKHFQVLCGVVFLTSV